MKSFLAVSGMVLVAVASVVALAYGMADTPDTPDWVPISIALAGFALMFGATRK